MRELISVDETVDVDPYTYNPIEDQVKSMDNFISFKFWKPSENSYSRLCKRSREGPTARTTTYLVKFLEATYSTREERMDLAMYLTRTGPYEAYNE